MTKQLMKISGIGLCVVLYLSACASVKEDVQIQTTSALVQETQAKTELQREPEVGPETDFYEYINKVWLEETKLGEEDSVINNFSQIQDRTDADIRRMLEDLEEEYDTLPPNSAEKKLMDVYRISKDFDTRNQLGWEPIRADLESIRSASTLEEFAKVQAELYKKGVSAGIRFIVDKDIKNSDRNLVYWEKPEFGISKANFEDSDSFAKEKQEGFKTYLAEIFAYVGYEKEEALHKADLVYRLEESLAKASLPQEEESDQEALYHLKTWEEVREMAPHVPIWEVADRVGLAIGKEVVITQPKFLAKLEELYTQEHLEALKAQLEYRLVSVNKNNLSKDLVEIGARFTGISEGAFSIPTEEEIAYYNVSDHFSGLLGKIYVDKYFRKDSKEDVLQMVEEVKSMYESRIKAVDWLSPQTKAKALQKLATIDVKIAYPDTWESYEHLHIDASAPLVDNLREILYFEQAKDSKKLTEKASRKEWGMPPYMVNAYYNPVAHEIVFPAAILQPPFYDPNASKEENLGGIGAVIGHEVSHAFDSQGAMFDENGNFTNWWQAEDFEKFQSKVEQAADIYSKLEVAPGYYVNGQISTGEIMADLGGLTVAVEIAKQKGYDTKKVFISYAKVWRERYTREYAISNIEDVHPPGMYRVNNIVNQIDQFYKDFGVKEGDAMYVAPSERLKVW